MRPVERDPRVALLSLDELAADKVLALFGRAAARDYQDVTALRRHFSWTVLLELASEKDARFSIERFLDAIAAFERLDPDDSISLGRLTGSCRTRSLPGPRRSALVDEFVVVGQVAAAAETGLGTPCAPFRSVCLGFKSPSPTSWCRNLDFTSDMM
jgi:hypothetical protein